MRSSRKNLLRTGSQFRWGWFGIGLSLACYAGCDKSGIEKVIVEGNVTYAGVPIDNGEIRFYPADGTVGPVSGAPISGGKYVAEAKGGVPVGTHQVQIRGFRASKQAAVAGANGKIVPGGEGGAPEQFVPPEFNSKSKLTVTIGDETRRVTKDFDIAP